MYTREPPWEVVPALPRYASRLENPFPVEVPDTLPLLFHSSAGDLASLSPIEAPELETERPTLREGPSAGAATCRTGPAELLTLGVERTIDDLPVATAGRIAALSGIALRLFRVGVTSNRSVSILPRSRESPETTP